MFTIKNNNLIVEISEKAAEVHSLKKINDSYNYVWSGDETYWRGRNPILFPQVSSTENKTTRINGVSYPMGNHGFARDSIFKLKEQKEDELTLVLNENEETLKQYPFNFDLFVTYKLKDNQLLITYKIVNNSNIKMPYGFGLHPAFNCANNYEDTKVVFNEVEEEIGKELIISNELFKKRSTTVIENPKANKATLISKDKKISVHYDGFKVFAIWSKGPFVCLEPWMNQNNPNPNIDMKDREGYKELDPNQSVIFSYSWEVE